MNRQKRKYLMLLLASVVLMISIAFLYESYEKTFTYIEIDAVIESVETEFRESGTAGDSYYYTESDLKCSYTVNGFRYHKTFTIKADYTGWEGKTIRIMYNKTNPYDSVIESRSFTAFLYSLAATLGSIVYIVLDIRKWVKIRKQEMNDRKQQTDRQSDENAIKNERQNVFLNKQQNRLQNEQQKEQYYMLQKKQKITPHYEIDYNPLSQHSPDYEITKLRQKVINIILTIAAVLLLIPLSVIELPLIVFTIARLIDYHMCYKYKT